MNRLAFPLLPCEIGSLQVASVAQLVEQLTLNQLVLGSSPSRGTNFIEENGAAPGPRLRVQRGPTDWPCPDTLGPEDF